MALEDRESFKQLATVVFFMYCGFILYRRVTDTTNDSVGKQYLNTKDLAEDLMKTYNFTKKDCVPIETLLKTNTDPKPAKSGNFWDEIEKYTLAKNIICAILALGVQSIIMFMIYHASWLDKVDWIFQKMIDLKNYLFGRKPKRQRSKRNHVSAAIETK